MSGLELVSVNNDLALDVKRNEIKNKIIARINELGVTVATYRLNNEFLLLVCNLVEHLVNKKKYKIDKKVLVVEILNQLFTLNTVEKTNVESNIEFLWNNKNIKKVSAWKLFCVGVREYFSPKKG
jgi:hypothetical protein